MGLAEFHLLRRFVVLVPFLFWEGLFALPSLQGNYQNDLRDLDLTAIFNVVDAFHQRTSDSIAICNGRLTLTTGTAVTTSDVTDVTTIYFALYNGARISLYANSKWNLLTFAETSVTVPSTTVTPFDIFGYSNAGTLALETVNWTNDTTRATALTTQDGVSVKSGDSTRRYLGTARTTGSSGKTSDTASNRFLWNMCNRVPRKLKATLTGSYSYTTATWRAAGDNTTSGQTRLEFVLGQQLEPVTLEAHGPHVINTTNSDVAVGIGIGSTSANSADVYGGTGNGTYGNVLAYYSGFPGTGYNYGQWLEISTASGTSTWYLASGSVYQVGLVGESYQ